MTALGYRNIEDLRVGDYVLSYNEKTQLNEYKPILMLYAHKSTSDAIYEVTIDGEIIKVTGAHRFYIKTDTGYTWLAVKEFNVGDYVRYADGTEHMIESLKHYNAIKMVYNFEVKDNHNYYVGKKQILVHNYKTTK